MLRESPDWFFNSITALQGDLFAYAFSITKSREDAEDAVQNAIIKAFDGLPDLRNRARLKPWLFRILRNECLLLLRQGKRFAALTPEIPALKKLVPELEIVPVDAPELAALHADRSSYDDDVTRLVYIRPAVYTETK